ncbi:MAG: Metallo-beta-lactamase superfamily protein [Promethearchaeota archaeon]|nr:MAG: Metallo-beta-lactamase superfamily protein [Candidatus Lokiarchaeota archaeon]
MSGLHNNIKFFIGLFSPKSFNDNSCHLIPSFGNMGIIETVEGLVVFDIALKDYAPRNFKTLRKITEKPIKYIIYSHGHFDHCFGFEPFIDEIKEKGWDMPEVIAHERVVKRFEKYQMLDEYHDWLNAQQFSSIRPDKNKVVSPHETLDPTIVLHGDDIYAFELGGVHFELNHDIGETDDSLWLWVPEKELICTGDLMISSYPNVGNPYKVQRYPNGWATAMERMMKKEAKYIIPGHGELIEGKDKVREVLSITAEAMHFVHDEVVKRLNQGKWFEEIYHEMLEIYPDKFKNHEYLQPLYGCYQFAIHATYRLYHGWYDTGNPTDLFPAPSEDIANEFLKINSATAYINHAKMLLKENKLQLALHIIDTVIKAKDSIDKEHIIVALNLKYEILKQKVEEEPSFIGANILNNGAKQIKSELKTRKKK